VIWSSSSGANKLELLPLAPDHVGLTIKAYPSLCWILTGKPLDGARMMFSLVNSKFSEPTLEVQLPESFLAEKSETCHCLNLKDYGIQLEPNTQYRWFISIAQKPELLRGAEIVAGGMIERCDITDCLMIIEVHLGCDMESVKSYARSGFWYDSISCLCDLIKSNPNDRSLPPMLHSLMVQGGFQKIPGALQDPYLIPLK
jgi:hypothetical protein